MEPIAARLPYQVCVGNHEHYYNFSGYLHRFEMPKANASHYHYLTTPRDPRSEPKRPAPMAASPDNLFFSFDVGGVHWLAYIYVWAPIGVGPRVHRVQVAGATEGAAAVRSTL